MLLKKKQMEKRLKNKMKGLFLWCRERLQIAKRTQENTHIYKHKN
jgi:hypothetical protein